MAVSALLSRSSFRTSGPNMRLESDRLSSYEGWTCPFLSPVSLAKAGFYYTKREDVVRCAYCGVEIGRWEQGDDAMQDHKRWSPNCVFLKTNDLPGEDTCGPYILKPNSVVEGDTCPAVRSPGIPYRKPAYPGFAIHERRLSSFKDWPKAMKQRPAELADAGFFYTGKGDETMCFYCGGGLKGWEDDDIPWEQHAIAFSKCNFLLLKKTRQFVDQVAKKMSEATLQEKPTQEASLATNTKEEEEDEDQTKFEFLCKICLCKKDGVVFTPCQHMVACVDCAPAMSKCPFCRTQIQSAMRVFLP